MAYDYAKNCSYRNIDAFFAVGDFADSGSFDEMLKFKKVLDKAIKKDAKICLMLASHEFKSEGGEEGAIKRFKGIFGMNPDNSFTLNSYSFICISVEEGCRIKDKKKLWLKSELQKAAEKDPKKPIFVFQHPHLSDTVYGSIGWGDDDIISILMDYPQVVDFSGHSHAPINDPRNVYQKYFTCFGTGSFHYFELDEFDKIYGAVPPDSKNCGQFLIVEVDSDNRVRVIPADAISGKFFNEGWLIEKPWDPDSFIYTRDRAFAASIPYFPENTRCDILYDNNKISIRFTQALADDGRVNSYTAVIKRAEDKITLCQKNISSSYYLYDMPETVCLEFELELKSGVYILEITANGFWNNRSEKFVKRFEI